MSIKSINLIEEYSLEEYREEPSRDESGTVIRIHTDSGWRTADSPFHPVEEARSTITDEQLRGNSIIILGAGSGFIAVELIKKGFKDILIITGSKILAKKNIEKISVYDSTEFDIRVLICKKPCKNMYVSIREFIEVKKPVKVISHPREPYMYPNLFHPLEIYIDSILYPNDKKAAIPPKRVFFPSSNQLLEPIIAKELRNRGFEVLETGSFSARRLDHKNAWKLMGTIQPDLVLSINNKGSDKFGFIPEICNRLDIPWATWFLDEPKFIVSKEEGGQIQKRFNFCWDGAGIRSCCDLGFDRATLLPLATDPALFSPGKGDKSLKGRIVYVGSPSFGNEDKYFSSFNNDRSAQIISEFYENEMIEKRKIPTPEEMTATLDDLKLTECFTKESIARLPAFVLYKANLKYRIAALSAVSELRPIVYGDGWEGLLPDKVEVRKYVDYQKELVGVYRSDSVHISLTHLQMWLYPNQRVFDVGSCGRVVIGEKLKGWNELFGDELSDLIFNDFDELYEKALFFADNPEQRRDMGESLRKAIIEKHTIKHRIDTMFDVIYS